MRQQEERDRGKKREKGGSKRGEEEKREEWGRAKGERDGGRIQIQNSLFHLFTVHLTIRYT